MILQKELIQVHEIKALMKAIAWKNLVFKAFLNHCPVLCNRIIIYLSLVAFFDSKAGNDKHIPYLGFRQQNIYSVRFTKQSEI
jgi:hypothetical protein